MSEQVVTSPAPETGSSARSTRAGHSEVWGWLVVLALAIVVAISLWPVLGAPFGDSHEGKVFARYAMQVQNLFEKGLVGSSFVSDMSPYFSVYAHHPPLPNYLDALVASLLPGPGGDAVAPYEIRLAPYLLAVLAVPAGAWLLRSMRLGWFATVLALTLMVATGFFWVYTRLQFEVAPILAMAAGIVNLRRRGGGWLLAGTCFASFLATLATWSGMAIAAVLGLWLLTGRRPVDGTPYGERPRRWLDKVTVCVGASMAVAAGLGLTFVYGLTGGERVGSQVEFRVAGGGFTLDEFLERQWEFATSLLPPWYLVLLPLGILIGLIDRRTRFLTVAFTALEIGWVGGLSNGAYIHDYWGYLVLLPGLVGMAALLDGILSRLPKPIALVSTAIAMVALMVSFVGMAYGEMGRSYVTEPLAAGRLVSDHGPAPGQKFAWQVKGGSARWLSYQWNLPRGDLAPWTIGDANPTDLALLWRDRVPEWLDPAVFDTAIAHDGKYYLVRIEDVQRNLIPQQR